MLNNKFLRLLLIIAAIVFASYFYYTSDKINPKMPEQNPFQEVEAISLDEYMADMGKRIKSNWNKVELHSSYTILVGFDIDSLGNISNLKILQSSGNKQADDRALEAVINAQPFMSSKALNRQDSVNVEFQFDYNINAPKY